MELHQFLGVLVKDPPTKKTPGKAHDAQQSRNEHESWGQLGQLGLIVFFDAFWLSSWWFQPLWKILGRIIPYIMENKVHVWNHQPAMTMYEYGAFLFETCSLFELQNQVVWSPTFQFEVHMDGSTMLVISFFVGCFFIPQIYFCGKT